MKIYVRNETLPVIERELKLIAKNAYITQLQ